jgi:hypothetical protein
MKPLKYRLVHAIERVQPRLRARASYERRGWAWRWHERGARTLLRLEYGRSFVRRTETLKTQHSAAERRRQELYDRLAQARRHGGTDADLAALAGDQMHISGDLHEAVAKLLREEGRDR